MANGNPFYVEPQGGYNIGAGLTGLAQNIEERKERERVLAASDAATKRFAAAKTAAIDAYRSGDPDRIAQTMMAYPEVSGVLNQSVGFRNKATRDNLLESLRIGIVNPDKIPELIQTRTEFVRAQGGDPSNTEAELERYNANPEKYVETLKSSWAALDFPSFNNWREATDENYKGKRVSKQEILPGGVIIQSMEGGGRSVFSASGRLVEGEEAERVIREAEERGADLSARAAGGRTRASLEARGELEPDIERRTKLAEQAATKSEKTLDQVGKVREGIATLDEVIQAIDEGAGTGAIQSKLPSVRAASIKLDNLQKQLGLNVIQSTTFGALSEAELGMALQTALPTGLNDQDLREWVVRKKAAQEKLADYLTDYAVYLAEPGASAAGWAKMKRDEARQRQEGEKPSAEPSAPAQSAAQAPRGYPEGTIIRNPQTNQRLIMRGGQWVPYGQ